MAEKSINLLDSAFGQGTSSLRLQRPKSGKYYSFQEIQDFYNISRTTLIKWIRTENIPTIDVGRAKRVRKDVFDDVLRLKRYVEEDT